MRKLARIVFVTSLLVITALIRPSFAAPLDDNGVKTLITNLGYTTTVTTSNNINSYWFTVGLPDNSYNIQFYLQLSADKTELWLVAALFKIPPGKTAPQSALMGLLTENDAITPKSFSYNKGMNTFYLNARMRNDNVTPAQVRQAIDSMTSILSQTEPFWVPDKWPAS
jgi:hypothetical protein